MPDFFSRAGEKLTIPSPFHAVTMAASLGVSCERCSHAHYLLPFAPRHWQPRSENRE
jgi:hypothetical protein